MRNDLRYRNFGYLEDENIFKGNDFYFKIESQIREKELAEKVKEDAGNELEKILCKVFSSLKKEDKSTRKQKVNLFVPC